MPDWSASMEQTFEFYKVDPNTWQNEKLLTEVTSCSITRDVETDTLASASVETTDNEGGEFYLRPYLVTIQNGITEKFPLGAYLMQTPIGHFDGRVSNVSVDAYSPLVELQEKPPTLGYSLLRNEDIMLAAYTLARENARAPVVRATSNKKLKQDFVSNLNDTWLTFISDLVMDADFTFDLDEMGRILFSPKQNAEALQPVFIYTEDNSSILYPEIDIEEDLYGVPNVVEVIYSKDDGYYYSRAENTNSNSPVSIPNRGREIVLRDSNPSFAGTPNQMVIDEYADNLLLERSKIQKTISYTHGFNNVRPNDCVMLDYRKAGLNRIKAKVIRQIIKCEPGCPVSETAIFTANLWR